MDSGIKKRVQRSIPLQLKLKILEEVEKKTFSKSQIAEIFNIPRSTLSTIIKNKEKIDRAVAAGSKTGNRKRLRSPPHVNLELKLLEWFQSLKDSNTNVSTSMIREKALEICKFLDIKDFDCSKGWLNRFQKRNISDFALENRLNTLEYFEASDWLKYFDHLKSSYSDKDIFSLDETGVFFNLLPDRSLHSSSDGMSDETLTVVLCCNAIGTEKLKLWIIGKYKNPAYIRSDHIETYLPFDYSYQKNAWIDSILFREWLIKFQQRMAVEDRRVLLTIDYCTAHKIDYMDLPNVRVVFFPSTSSTTQNVQPLRQGIMENLKRNFKLRLVRFTIVSIESKQFNPRWNSLQAMKALAASWESVSPETIRDSFQKAWNYNSPRSVLISDFEEPAEWKILKNMVSSENVCFSDFVQIDDDLATCSLSDDDDEEYPVDSDDESTIPVTEDDVIKPSKNELFSALSVIHSFAQVTPDLDLGFIDSLEKVTKDCVTCSYTTKLQ